MKHLTGAPSVGSAVAIGLALAVGLVTPATVASQSLLAGRGLGLLAEPLDARSRGLGGGGIGLPEAGLVPMDPSSAAGLILPVVSVTYQPTTAVLTSGLGAGHVRFPSVGVAYPIRANVLSLQLSSFLDQEWQSVTQSEILLDGAPVSAIDQFSSSGGISRAQLGWARTIFEDFQVGVTVGRYAGTMDRAFVRSLDSDDLGTPAEVFVTAGRWTASGTVIGVGAAWNAASILRVAGSTSWSQDLEMTRVGGDAAEGRAYSMPLELRLGGTLLVLPDLSVAGGVTFADWSDTGADLADPGSRGATWSFGVGAEASGARILGRAIPLRVGARQVQLPFSNDGAVATERMIAAGVGIHLAEVNEIPLAVLDVAYEAGQRRGGSLSESFRRTTITLRVSGN